MSDIPISFSQMLKFMTGFAMLVGAELNEELAKISNEGKCKKSMNRLPSQKLILQLEILSRDKARYAAV